MRLMILAAGRGTRMGQLTEATPKPLLEVAGKALIEHTVERARWAGFRDIVVNLAYLGHRIVERLGDGSRLGVRIRYSWEREGALDSGGGIHAALPLLGGGPFAVVNADVWTDFPLARLRGHAHIGRPIGRRERTPTLAHLVLVKNAPHHPLGDFALDHHGLARPSVAVQWTFSGIGAYHPDLFTGCTEAAFPLAPLLREQMRHDAVTAEIHPGLWYDVGTPERLHEIRCSGAEERRQM